MSADLAISECADELAKSAENAPDLERQDALTALAAVARGDPIPKPVVDRIRRRYGGA